MLLIKTKQLYVHDDDLGFTKKGNVFAFTLTTIWFFNAYQKAFAGLPLEVSEEVLNFIQWFKDSDAWI